MHLLKTRNHFTESPHHRGFFYALILVYLGVNSLALAESNARILASWQCQTLDPQGRPVPYVSLILQPSSIWLLSDDQGHFQLAGEFLNNDSLLLQRIGFQDRKVDLKQVLQDGFVQIKPALLRGESVDILASRESQTSPKTMTHFSKSSAQGLLDHQQVLMRLPGLTLRSYGGPAGINTLSMDGGPSSHTKVLVNEIDITSAQNGEADLSQLPLPLVESMSYIPFDISGSGSGTIDGQIRLSSRNSQNQLSVSTGSYGHRSFDVGIVLPLTQVQTYIQMGQRHETANYPYSWSNHQGLRQNNQFDQEFMALNASALLASDLYLRISALESHQSRGVAGLVWSPDTLSHRDDVLRLMGSTLGWIRPQGSTHLNLTWRQSREHYQNPFLALDSEHALKSLHLGLRDVHRLHSLIEVISDINWHADQIRSSDTQFHERQSWDGSLTAIFQLTRFLRLAPALKGLYSKDLYQESYSDFQVSFMLPTGPLENLSAGVGQLFNYPSFNDLYWEPGGNPALQAERTQVQTIQSTVNLRRLGLFKLQWQLKDSENLIQWMPVQSYWQPSNVVSAVRESRKLIWQLDLPEIDLDLYAHYTWIRTEDEALSKPLRYAPTSTSALSLAWKPGAAEFHLDHHNVSDRISMYSWPEDIILEGARIWSASLAWSWILDQGRITLVLSGDNLTDISYESVRGYPEAGRSYRITSNLNF